MCLHLIKECKNTLVSAETLDTRLAVFEEMIFTSFCKSIHSLLLAACNNGGGETEAYCPFAISLDTHYA